MSCKGFIVCTGYDSISVEDEVLYQPIIITAQRASYRVLVGYRKLIIAPLRPPLSADLQAARISDVNTFLVR